MTKGLPRSLSRASLPRSPLQVQTVVVRALALNVVGATGVGFGFAIAGDFPEGNLLFLGGVANLRFSGSGSDADLVDTWEGDFSVGTTGTTDATLGGGDANLVGTTPIAAATAEVSPITRGINLSSSTGAVLDNTTGSLEVNVSLTIDDADISGTAEMTVDGEIYLQYSVLGDD